MLFARKLRSSRIVSPRVVPLIRPLFAVLLASPLLLAACAAQPAYHPYSPMKFLGIGGDGTGYSQTPVRPDVYEVGYNGSNNPTQCRYFATLRAAELALQDGKPWFEIIQAFPGESPATWALLNNAPAQPDTAALAAATLNTDGHIVNLDNPTSSIIVHFLSSPSGTSLNAVDLLRQAQGKGILLSPETQSRLNASTLPSGGR